MHNLKVTTVDQKLSTENNGITSSDHVGDLVEGRMAESRMRARGPRVIVHASPSHMLRTIANALQGSLWSKAPT